MSGEDTVTSLASTLKLSKENFVSNHSGTNLAELCILFAVVPCVTFLLQLHGSPCQPGLLCPVSQSACIVLPTVLAVVSNNLIWAWLLIVLVLVSVSVGWSSLPHTVAITRSLQHLAEQPTKRSGKNWEVFDTALACAKTVQLLCSTATSHQCEARHSCVLPYASWLWTFMPFLGDSARQRSLAKVSLQHLLCRPAINLLPA